MAKKKKTVKQEKIPRIRFIHQHFSVTKHNSWSFWALILVSIMFYVVMSNTLLPNTLGFVDCGTNTQCFNIIAQGCHEGTVIAQDGINFARYTVVQPCAIVKQYEKFSPDEDPLFVTAVSGTDMSCPYYIASYNPEWTTGIMGGIEGCNGMLKDILSPQSSNAEGEEYA